MNCCFQRCVRKENRLEKENPQKKCNWNQWPEKWVYKLKYCLLQSQQTALSISVKFPSVFLYYKCMLGSFPYLALQRWTLNNNSRVYWETARYSGDRSKIWKVHLMYSSLDPQTDNDVDLRRICCDWFGGKSRLNSKTKKHKRRRFILR